MKRTILAVLLGAMTVASVASLMMRPAKADIRIFTANLLPSNEVAPVVVFPTEVNGSGFATITIDTTANTARFDVTLSGFASNSVVILTHIHEGGAGINGPVRVDSGITPGAPIPLVQGGGSFTRSNLSASASIISAILANPSGFYFNVHTTLSPGGVARGQLVPQQVGGLTVPTLSEWGAILMFLLFAAVATFFLVGRKQVLAAAAGYHPGMLAGPHKAVDWKLLAKVSMYVEAAIGFGLGLVALASKVNAVDVLGALVSGIVVAFIVHLMIGSRRS